MHQKRLTQIRVMSQQKKTRSKKRMPDKTADLSVKSKAVPTGQRANGFLELSKFKLHFFCYSPASSETQRNQKG
jgi:hypothetical protein